MIRIIYNVNPCDTNKYLLVNENGECEQYTTRTNQSLTSGGNYQNAYFINRTNLDPNSPDLVSFLNANSTTISVPQMPNQTHKLINENIQITFSDSAKFFFTSTNFQIENYSPKIVLSFDELIKIQKTTYNQLGKGFEWFVHLYKFNTLGAYFEIQINDLKNEILINYQDLCFKQRVKDENEIIEHESAISKSLIGENKIFYGVPGNGKSKFVDKLIKQEIQNDEERFTRVIFYPDFNYSDFIGQIVPSTDENGRIYYDFKPNSLVLILEKALLNPEKSFFLIIEEINRGNAQSIFGDFFQLLDRDKFGESIYQITNKMIQDYLEKSTKGKLVLRHITLPKNLFIYATMNTSDQNVFTLDTSFKRRWQFELVNNDINKCDYKNCFLPTNDNLTWGEFLNKINLKILGNQSTIGNFDDKQIGVFFVDQNSLIEDIQNPYNMNEKAKKFAYKILEYLWNDVFKLNRDIYFPNFQSLEEVVTYFIENGFGVRLSNLINE
jgi:hypothetical protein